MALKLRPKGHLLDVGCGPGSFLQLAKSSGYQVAGIDVSPVAIKMARKFGLSDTYVMSIEEALSQPWQRRFDIVCLFDVLEHLEDPASALSESRKLLKRGGYLVCTVPSYQRWPPLFDPYVDLPPHHLTLWTIKALERCVSSAGFTVIKSIRSPLTTEQLSPHMLWRFRILLQLGFVSTLIKAFTHAVIGSPAVRILSLNPKAGGFTLMVVAQK
jgi:SAM-dependent methyltransferase